jgi:protocatechuate 3,4-dioxygenase beta subunit
VFGPLRTVIFLASCGLLSVSTAVAARLPHSGTGKAAAACPPMAEAIEGPFYFDPKLDRSDITQGRKGAPTSLNLRVVGTDCSPVPGARVDVWHADAQGVYSGYPGQGDKGNLDTRGQTFLRGSRSTDANGLAHFETIYPGWYRGRATHIHFKVWLGNRPVDTGQIYLPDPTNASVYKSFAPYKRLRTRDTFNATDRFARAAGRAAFATLTEENGRYVVSITVSIDKARRVRRHL